MMPTVVWVNLAIDTAGDVRGFEKARELRYFMDEDGARYANYGNQQYRPTECVIMSRAEYEEKET